MKKILILGANSYIGTSFHKYVKREYPEQYDVDVVSLRGDDWKLNDWSDYDSVINVTGKAHADISTLTEEQKREYYSVNCNLACEAAKKAIADGPKQYIYFSSIIVYGDSSNNGTTMHITGQSQPNPTNFYGDSKWQAEQQLTKLFDTVEMEKTKLVILRPPMIYGKDSKGNFKTLVKLAEKIPVFPTYHNERSMLYIENLAECLKILIEENREGVFLPQNERYVSTAEMVREIACVKGRKIYRGGWLNPLLRITFCFPGKLGNMVRKAFGSMTIENSLSNKVEGYQRYDLKESIKRSI